MAFGSAAGLAGDVDIFDCSADAAVGIFDCSGTDVPCAALRQVPPLNADFGCCSLGSGFLFEIAASI